jgi:small subunit ribosomal protein S1
LSFSSDDFAKALEQHDYTFQRGQVVRGKIAVHDADGVYVDIGGKATAFLPADEAWLGSFKSLDDILPLGEERDFLIIREQNADGQVTLSVRQLQIQKRWDELQEMLDEGETLQVRVMGVNKGGLNVDVDGLRGFVPRSHLLDKENLEGLVGRFLSVAILEVDRDRRRLVLSERVAARSASLSRLALGQLVEGRVVGMKPFGVFVEFEGTTGLLHINQVSKNFVESLTTIFTAGQTVKAVIIDLDTIKKRIALSTKVLESYPGEMLEKPAEVMEKADERMEKVRQTLVKDGVLME